MGIKKITPKKSKLLISFFIVMIILLFVLFATICLPSFLTQTSQDELNSAYVKLGIIIVIWLIVTIVFSIILVKNNYYEVTKTSIIHHRFTNVVTYDFANVLYIDEYYTKKHKTLLYYTNKGKNVFLVMDKNEELLKLMEQNSHNQISREEFHARFPKIRL
jgi:Na+/proline symporter